VACPRLYLLFHALLYLCVCAYAGMAEHRTGAPAALHFFFTAVPPSYNAHSFAFLDTPQWGMCWFEEEEAI